MVVALLRLVLCLVYLSVSFSLYGKTAVNVLRIVATEHPLLHYKDKGKVKGTTAEILSDLLAETNLKAKIEFMPWARAYYLAENRPNTLILSMAKTPERIDKFYWIGVVSQFSREYIFRKDKTKNHINSDEEAKKRDVAVIRGTNSYNILINKGFIEGKNLYVASSMRKAIKLLLKGRIDLFYHDPKAVQAFIDSNSSYAIYPIAYLKKNNQKQYKSYIAINIHSSPELINKLKKAMDKISKTERYQQLLRH